MDSDGEMREYLRESFEKKYGNLEHLNIKVAIYQITSYLNQAVSFMSPKTMQMQKCLFWALFVQTVIPICVSFMPCTLVLYGSVFRLDFSSPVNYMSSVAISTFPFLDPLAITMCLPALRRRLFGSFGRRIAPNSSYQTNNVLKN
ncbi:hypothetical protein B9Z55_016999 [Caenorhabditis nigoni]|uniref:Uncharacterized protein n=1 Tax=Caenorhabditis nigoni TaxID=1611254 RepID=A0A2G5T7M7_9PELO|nr:hypothetical protein B9Z55_016999 [Caenorhabditis nigoni]